MSVVCVAGCSGAPTDLGPFTIQVSLDDSPGSGCGNLTCDDFGMRCGALVSLRIREVDSGRLVTDACQAVAPAPSLCDLADLDQTTFFEIPPTRLRIELAAWRPELLEDPDICPTGDLFDSNGQLRVDFSPRPAFAGSTLFDAGEDVDLVTVPLGCSQPSQIDEPSCSEGTLLVTALVDDIDTARSVTQEQAQNLSVAVAEPRESDGIYVISAADSSTLVAQLGPVPTFADFLNRTFEDIICTVVLDLAPQSTPAVMCAQVPAVQNPLDVRGILVPKQILDEILLAASLTVFPVDGLVIGRVVDHQGLPLAEVTVTPSAGTVLYLNADRSALVAGKTSLNGYFASFDAPFGTTWTASHPDGRTEA